jgi:hypothetical protein
MNEQRPKKRATVRAILSRRLLKFYRILLTDFAKDAQELSNRAELSKSE